MAAKENTWSVTARARVWQLEQDLRARLAACEAELARVRAERDMLRNSRIWRATAPLRWLKNRLAPPRRAAPALENPDVYARWIANHDTLTDADRAAIRAHGAELPDPPSFSILIPVHDPDPGELHAAIGSVRAQLYPHWEAILADDGSTRPDTGPLLAALADADDRIRLVRIGHNQGIAAATNAALAMAVGRFVALMDQDDLLAETALYEAAVALAEAPDTDLLFSDEDHLDADGQRTTPYFKPDFSIELLRGHNLVSHLGIYRRSVLVALGGLRTGFEGSQDYDLALRVADHVGAARIRHIPQILYHWRQRADSYSKARAEVCAEAARRAVAEHLVRCGEAGSVIPLPEVPGWNRVILSVPSPPPLVSVLLPTRDAAALLRRAAHGVLHETTYPVLELLVLDNGTTQPAARAELAVLAQDARVRVVDLAGPFNFAWLNNQGAAAARGEVLILLNNDIEVIDPGWVTALVSQALRPGIGAVGARLLYPDWRIQHAGVVLGVGGVANHFGLNQPQASPGYFGANMMAREVAAVTAACLAVRAAHWHTVGGMDAQALPVAFNDVDFCLRLRTHGLRNLYEPQATLIHHESATRGDDMAPEHLERFTAEVACMRARWGEVLDHDPFYHRNFSRRDGNFCLDPAAPGRRSWQ